MRGVKHQLDLANLLTDHFIFDLLSNAAIIKREVIKQCARFRSSALSPAAGVKKKSVIRPKASTANIAHSASTSFIAVRFPFSYFLSLFISVSVSTFMRLFQTRSFVDCLRARFS